MRRILKYFPASLLYLAGLAFCAHMLIIHDHHLPIGTSEETPCSAANDKAGHSQEYPIHCHAFNDVASEKAAAYQFASEIPCSELPIPAGADDYLYDLPVTCITVSDILNPFPDSGFPDSCPLRAPPSLS